MLFDLFGPLLGPLLIVIMVIVVFESCWRKCPPDKLMIVSGFGQTRSVSGKGTFVIPGLQRVDTLALGAVQVQLSTENEIPTQDAILIHACAVANFQIGQTPELIEIASKNYLNMDKAEMTRQVTEVMLGKMREVIGQMDLKELMRDRESFNHKVFEGRVTILRISVLSFARSTSRISQIRRGLSARWVPTRQLRSRRRRSLPRLGRSRRLPSARTSLI